LSALLHENWPGAGKIFGRLDSAIALAFLTDYPTPQSAERLGEARMAMFCKRHGYSGRHRPDELLNRLGTAPVSSEGLEPKVLGHLVMLQVKLLDTLLASISELDQAITVAVLEHPKAELLRTLPRIGTVNLAQVLAEVGPILERSTNCQHASAEAGASPVTKESGKARSVNFRWAANSQARKALSTFADNSRHSSAWADKLYKGARAKGKRHPHAVRILMRAWMRVIWACWHSGVSYDPTKHGGERLALGATA
jgi:transposase